MITGVMLSPLFFGYWGDANGVSSIEKMLTITLTAGLVLWLGYLSVFDPRCLLDLFSKQ
jgi:hypothetical protein